jgi:predicted short-subunit dehydrogenase-like oxidoreductase (DUF2520 family)
MTAGFRALRKFGGHRTPLQHLILKAPKQNMNPREEGIAIIGPGRVGQALGRLLSQKGFLVLFVAARRREAAQRAVRFIGSGRPVSLDAPELTCAPVILLTTSDAALAPLARRLASLGKDWSGRVVLHTSGSVPASVLAPLKRRGAAIGSLHPYQTIPNPATGVRNLPGGFWGIEGDPAARQVATRWIRALRGVAFPIRPEKKILYHAAAFMVCPTLVTLMDQSVKFLSLSGVPDKIARPMLARFVTETVKNFVELGGRKALTGPASRGDWQIIRRHLAALRRDFPGIVSLYQELLRAMLRLAGKRAPVGLTGTRRISV